MPRLGLVRALALATLTACLALGFACRYAVPDARAGAPEYQAQGFVAVPFGRASVFGGNLQIERRDLDFDTRLGNVAIGAVWNSADARWRFGFELEYDGTTFVDATGARYAVGALAPGQPIPGSIWVRLDARTLRTKGGLVHEFDVAGRLAAVRFASAAYPRLEYRRTVVAGASRVTELRQLAEAGSGTRLASFGYDAAGRLASIEDRSGRRAELTWNGTGQLVAARDAFDVETNLPGYRYAYDAQGLALVTSSEGVRAEFTYSAERRLARVRARGAGDPTTSFAYESLGATFRTTVTDPFGRTTRFEWDPQRRLRALENPRGERMAWTWTGLRPDSQTGPDGVATRWTWSGDDLVLERQPSGNVVSFVWEPAGENRADPARRALRRATDSLGLVAERGFDARGRLARMTNGAGESWSYTWNGDNLLATATDPAGVETRYRDYGEHGRPRRVERGGNAESHEYDSVGNLRFGAGNAALPGAGDTGVVSRSYDADRNLASVVLAEIDRYSPIAHRTLALTYRSDGQPVRIERPGGGDSEFAYDALGHAIERRDFSGGFWRSTRFERDLLGRTTSTQRPNGMRTETAYDEAGRGRLLEHRRGAATESSAGFQYESGRLVSISDSAYRLAPERYTYDSTGRVSVVRYPGGERLEIGYDLRSRIVRERYVAASGAVLRTLHFTYDLANREIELRDGPTPLRTLQFAAARLEEERLGNGLVRRYEYGGQDGLLNRTEMRGATGTLVERTTLAQRPGFGIDWYASTATFGALPFTSHEHFSLAPIAEGEPGPRAVAFSSSPDGTEPATYAYDVVGNLARIGVPEAPDRTFQFDAERSRLLRIRRASGAILHEYVYDEAGFAVVRDGEAVVWDGGGRPLSVGERASFRWDALGRIVSTTTEGATQRHLFGGRVRGTSAGAPVAIELGALSLDLLGNHRFRHLDFRGNVKLVSDAEGRIVSHVRYAPYGSDRVEGTPEADAGFAQGRSVGAELMLLGARIYDPDAARFLAPDPVFQLANQYAYADGNPIWYWDPDGRSAELAMTIAAGAALGTACVGAVIGVPAVTVFAFAFIVGLYVGPSSSTWLASGALGAAIGASRRIPVIGAVFSGFGFGGAVAHALQNDYGGGISGLYDRAGDRPDQPDFPHLTKVIELRAAEGLSGSPGGPGTGGDGGTGGCSPSALSEAPPRVGGRFLVLLLGAQGLLGGCLLWQRRRR